MSITFSGVKRCFEPSMCDLKTTPSSFISLVFDREKTWNPPLSVRIGFFQLMKLCRPLHLLRMSIPGRRYRWYVLLSIISAFTSDIRLRCSTAFTEATVPTGMNIGVFMIPCLVSISPRRACDFLSSYNILKKPIYMCYIVILFCSRLSP